MKTFLLFLLISMFCFMHVCIGQAYSFVYYFDKNLGNTKESKAVVVGRGIAEDGLFRLDYFGKQGGELLGNDHFVDSSLKRLMGQSARFHKNGKVESQGGYMNDQKDGLWQKWDSLGQKKDSIIYQHDKVIKVSEFSWHTNGLVRRYSFKDSIADTFTTKSYDEKGNMVGEVFFKGQSGILKRYDSGKVKVETLDTREEKDASFPGGQAGWIRYLQKNLNANTPVNNGAPSGKYQVIIKFRIAKDGNISQVFAETKWGYGMEKEVIRIIENGPAWEPATQYARKVNAYRRQPVTFIVDASGLNKRR